MKPLCIDLYCGLGGWAEGFLAEGYDVTGFDIEAHDYGTGGYPGKLVLRDVRAIHGSEFKGAACIVGSSPCQKYSYMAMPWKRAKEMARWYADEAHPERLVSLNELFDAQFRIQREASEAAGHHIPLVVENVRGAQKWVGQASWNYGSFYLWGDVPALMPMTFKGPGQPDGMGYTTLVPREGFKAPGQNWNQWKQTGSISPDWKMAGARPSSTRLWQDTGVKFSQSGDAWFDGTPRDKMLGDKGPAAYSSSSSARKAASAIIAKIPFPLARHIASCFKSECVV